MRYLDRHARPTDAVDALNTVLGTDYDLARLGQWRREERALPGIITGYLLGLSDKRPVRADKR